MPSSIFLMLMGVELLRPRENMRHYIEVQLQIICTTVTHWRLFRYLVVLGDMTVLCISEAWLHIST